MKVYLKLLWDGKQITESTHYYSDSLLRVEPVIAVGRERPPGGTGLPGPGGLNPWPAYDGTERVVGLDEPP